MSSKHIKDLLNSSKNSELAKALDRSEAIGQLTEALAAALPPDLGAAILSASVSDDGVLAIKASSSAWASRLRFETDQLAGIARAAGYSVKGIKVRVGRDDQA
jgi:hypothetical protein